MADIKVNEADWNGLSQPEREKINQIITGIFKEHHNIAPDTRVPKAAQAQGVAPNLAQSASNPFCTAACSIAEAAAVAACGALSGPAIPICVAAAHAAGELCRSRC